jgi:hypothetical protein
MEENRIQINGEWYIKESTVATPEPEALDLTYSESCIHETKKYAFQATRIYKDYTNAEFYDNCTYIEFTDKRPSTPIIDHWDNPNWLLSIYHNEKEALEEALELMDEDGVKELKSLVGELIKMGWITIESYE